MKKNLVFAALLGLVMTTFCGCGNISIGNKTVKGADGKEYDSYQSACRNLDFVAAYDWIEKNNGSEEDKDYVFNAEMLYLVSQNTEEASNRVLYLLAEYQIPGTPLYPNGHYTDKYYGPAKEYIEGLSRYNNRCRRVLDLAISQGNETLARKVIELFKQNVDIHADYSDWKSLEISEKGYNNSDKDAAKKRLEEAIKEGAFKNDGKE